jgi:hypothetical protein
LPTSWASRNHHRNTADLRQNATAVAICFGLAPAGGTPLKSLSQFATNRQPQHQQLAAFLSEKIMTGKPLI